MNGKEIERLAKVEVGVSSMGKRLTKVEDKLDEILTNRLPHLKQEIQSNKWKIALITGGAAFIGSKAVDFILK